MFVYFLLVSPRIIPFYFEENPLQSGQYAQINCLVAEGDLPIEITWTLNDKSIDSFAEISVAKVGKRSTILTIESVSYTSAGNYSCQAKNKAGKTEYITQLLVNG